MRLRTTHFVLHLLVIGIFLQGCSLTREFSDQHKQNAALDRWNQCLARFDTNVEHFCDGHRRDVLATYPAHMANHVDSLLEQQTLQKRVSRAVKTGLESTTAGGNKPIPEVLLQP